MDPFAVVVLLLAVIALVVVVVFFISDYLKHKDENTTDFKKANSRIDTEKSDRLSNLKFVVDQVNDVNTDIYQTMTSNVNMMGSNVDVVSTTQDKMVKGLDKFLQFSSNVSIATSPTVSLIDLPGTSQPDIKLIQHVNSVMGLTVSDLQKGKVTAEFCNKDNTRCIRFPDANGDTLLNTFEEGKNVVVDAPLKLKKDIRFSASTGADQAALSGIPGGMIVNTGKVGIGSAGFTNPTATLHLKSANGQDAFKITAASDAILVKADGEIVTSRPISLRNNVNDTTNVATISIANGTNNDKVLQIQASEVAVKGNLNVSGNIAVNGTGTLGGKAIQAA